MANIEDDLQPYIPTIDFNKSILILKEILSHFEDNEKIIINENMNLNDIYSDPPSTLNYRHKLRVTTLRVTSKLQTIKELTIAYIEAISYSETIEIHEDSEVDEKKKEFAATMYMHNMRYDCDVSYPTFEYIDEISTWVIMSEFLYGINDFNEIMFLDFINYD